MRRFAVVVLVLCTVGCGTSHPSHSEQRATARAFADAVLAGDSHAARSLVARHADRAVDEQARRLSAGFARHHAHLNGRARRSGIAQWAFPYRRRVNGTNGAFSVERGFLVVDTEDGRGGVTFAAIIGRVVEHSTHHDSVLLPSKR